MGAESDARAAAVDAALAQWRQGDCVLGGDLWFAHRFDPAFSLTQEGQAAPDAEAHLAEQEVEGFVVVTQTCDIVRRCADRPFVEVCPLVRVDEARLQEIRSGRRPNYGYLPQLAGQLLVVDLDRVMTVEKPVVAPWQRQPGWQSDEEGRAFAQALARKRVRAAFPDEFVGFVRDLQKRLLDKHDKNSPEGQALRALREIRVQANPHWQASKAAIHFWFVCHDRSLRVDGKDWADWLQAWLRLVPADDRFGPVDGTVVELVDMTAQDYVDSDPLDLDHLSAGP